MLFEIRKSSQVCLLALTLLVALALFAHAGSSARQDGFPEFETRSLDDPGLKTFLESGLKRPFASWPLQVWGITELTGAALYYQPQVQVARAKLQEAEAAVVTAGGRLNPEARVSPKYNATSAGQSRWLLAVDVDFPIETAGKRNLRIQAAKNRLKAARADFVSTYWQLRARIKSGLIDLYAARQTMELLDKQLKAEDQFVALLEKRALSGVLSPSELTVARINQDRARLSSHQAQAQEIQARSTLAEAIGIPSRALDAVSFSFDGMNGQLPEIASDAFKSEWLSRRSDLLSAQFDLEAAQSDLHLEKARRVPDVRVGPGYEYDQGDNKLGLNVSAPIYLFNRNQGPIAEAEARRTEATEKVRAEEIRIAADITRSLVGYRAALDQLKTADSLVAAQEKQINQTRHMMRSTEPGRLTLLGNQLELYSVQLLREESFAQTLRSLNEIEQAYQQPLNPAEPLFPLVDGIEERRP